MKKIHIKNRTVRISQILLAIFLLICGLFLLWLQIKTGKTSLEMSFITVVFLIFPFIGIYQNEFDKSDGLREIILTKGTLFFIGYKNKQKDYKEIKLDDIESCKFIFSKYYETEQAKDNNPCFFEICIKTKDNQNFSIKQEIGSDHYQGVIVEAFEMAKLIPNFSYEVDTDSDNFGKSIQHYAVTGKGRSVTDSLRTFFKDPKVNSGKKVLAVLALICLAFNVLFIFIVIAKTITDIMGG